MAHMKTVTGVGRRICRVRSIPLMIGCLLTLAAHAEVWSSGFRTITRIYPHDGGVTFFLDGDAIVGPSCPNRFYLPLTGANYNSKVAGLYTAYAQGKRIQANFSETDTGCEIAVNRFVTED
jgi:hypothetical protein